MTHCRLHAASGTYEECPRGWCAFWDRDRCALERPGVNLPDEPELVAYLLDLRRRLEAARATTTRDDLLPPGLAAD